ncbi:phosphatidylinositol glycan class L [Sphaerulina musiva SO2202]|uniref:N-acetylglucosaminylphosphatidylinositol deacetylase n=1 Tax=Sphaerulina musiva (strain SO2202) TaxID=692275 RepID=M3DBL1_SPHMS|nr:phosphatidylinositol glycan class L [Sphaerulina musiva SO2202]EMF15249.1 phosphatidylinositol glycan class L [Sphaerulina musiva SO2202]
MHTLSWQIPILILALWLFTAYMTRAFPTLTGKRICLVIAHPDDEAMFFAPTIRHLTRPELGNQVVILCFSSGDADGLGHIRKKELVASALLLGLRKPEHIVVIEDENNFPDSMTTTWDAKLISQTLMKYFAPSQTTTTTTTKNTLIDVLITFDEGGISGHPNHISLLHGCTTFLRTLMLKHTGWENPVKLYTLTTTNMVRKYSSVLDSLVSVLAIVLGKKERGAFASPLLMVSLPGDVRKAQQAMTTAHVSQMRWFRWGWIGISRYMVINDLKKR